MNYQYMVWDEERQSQRISWRYDSPSFSVGLVPQINIVHGNHFGLPTNGIEYPPLADPQFIKFSIPPYGVNGIFF